MTIDKDRARQDALNAKEVWTSEDRAEYDVLVTRTGYDPAETLDDDEDPTPLTSSSAWDGGVR